MVEAAYKSIASSFVLLCALIYVFMLSPAGSAAPSAAIVERSYESIASSCAIPFVIQQLSTASFADVCGRPRFYKALVRFVREFCRPEGVRCGAKAAVSTVLK